LPLRQRLNSAGNDIQPNVRKDGLEIVFSSNHAYPGAQGLQDVYVSTRDGIEDPWSTPVNLGTSVNTGVARLVPLSRGMRGHSCLDAHRARKGCPTSISPRDTPVENTDR
jgi:PHP family Zn ribbon phosphoesterase